MLTQHRALVSATHTHTLRRSSRKGPLQALVAQEEFGEIQTIRHNRMLITKLITSMDLNQDGLLTEQEMAVALQKVLGRAVTEEQLAALDIEWNIDKNGAKTISTEEFMLAVENGRATDFSKLSAAQVQSLMITRNSLDINPRSLLQSIKNVDEYKERSRQYRRTVFTNKDWVKFRSSDRLFQNLSTMFTSGIIRGLWIEVGTVTSIALAVFSVNWLISHGLVSSPAQTPKAYSLK